jgi:ligand-binding sensor domain-containing protein/signal transduction histidine kinase
MRPLFPLATDRGMVCAIQCVFATTLTAIYSPIWTSDHLVESWDSEKRLPNNFVTSIIQTHGGYPGTGTCNGLARGLVLSLLSAQTWFVHLLRQPFCRALCSRQLKWVAICTLFFFTILLAFCSSAKTADYLMDAWTSDDDLPDSSVTAIAQTPDGYLWIGTYNGLARFDGVRFVTFDPVNTPELKHARITGLFVDARGTLWINTYDGSMTQLRKGVFTHAWQGGTVSSVFSISNQVLFALAGHSSKMICRTEDSESHGDWKELPLTERAVGSSFRQDGSGSIWYILQDGSLGKTDGIHSEILSDKSGLNREKVNCLAVDSGGHIWVGTDKRIVRWNGQRFQDQTPTNGEASVNVNYLYCAGNGCWIFADGKVRKCVDRRWVADVDVKSWQDLAGTFRLDLGAYEDGKGGVWLTHYGMGLFHAMADGSTERVSSANGLPSDRVTSWFQDREGNLWAGLDRGGLVRLRKKQFQVIGTAEGLATPAVSTVCEDAQSNVWIGTFSGGLYRLRGDQLEQFKLADGAYKECFFSAYPDAHNQIWLSAGREDLYVLENNKINQSTGAVHGIKAILADKQGKIWLGRQASKQANLMCLDKGVLESFTAQDGLNDVHALAEDRQGNIWIGTGGGVLSELANGKFISYPMTDSLTNQAIWSLLPDVDGTLWIGTFRGGLLRFNNGKFTRYTTQNGLPSNIICQVLDDGQGKLWIGSHKGIFYVPKDSFKNLDAGKIQSLPCVSYGLNDGLPTLECSGNYQPSCWRGHDGRLWFATTKGLVSIFPGELLGNRLPPPVVIEEVLVDGKSISLPDKTNIAADDPAPVATLRISPGKHQFDFLYTALSFAAPDKVRFRYKLQELDDAWVEAGSKRSAHYGPLRPGKYRFQVIACNNDGVWNEQGASLAFIQLPQFYETNWFRFLTVLAAIAIVAGVARHFVIRRMQRDLEHLERERMIERDRARIAHDIHDDLGSGLTRIMLQSEFARRDLPPESQLQLGQIADTARGLTRALDEIVWAVDPQEDTLSGLMNYVTPFAEEFLRAAEIRCRIDLPDVIPPLHVDAESRYNLFLALKEVLNNIVKHAHACEVWLRLRLEHDGFTLVLEDNGRGLSDADAGKKSPRIRSGHGLVNLEKRLKAVGGKCVIESVKGVGTRIEMTVRAQAGGRYK